LEVLFTPAGDELERARRRILAARIAGPVAESLAEEEPTEEGEEP